MGRASDALIDFIEGVPDGKLRGFSDPNPAYTVYQTLDFRLDVQNMTPGDPPMYNIQVQINRETSISTLKRMNQKSKKSGTTVARALVPADGSWDAISVRQALINGRMV
ncbi:hypothetical protein V1517DRAFT_341959 [Lipomyces orientalis]|uniref:Uncharacterized protein n=1 Tax=Lipomyces orientalis TaxID=1233043 RepID=A0ACC3TDL0_9ASCO